MKNLFCSPEIILFRAAKYTVPPAEIMNKPPTSDPFNPVGIKYFRVPFVLLAVISLFLGLWTGLNRIGWNFAMLPANMHHGAMMVGGFLGSLIAIEKIIPLKKKILFLIPLLSVSAVLFFFLNEPKFSFILLVVASAALCFVFLYYFLREKNLIFLLMVLGSACWLTGNLMLLTRNFYPLAFPWWMGFILLIITAERLELMNFLPVSRSKKKLLVVFLILYLSGVLFSFHGPGHKISGSALIAISLWLMRYDIIGLSIHKPGLHGFVSTALLSGYTGMLFTGIFLLALDNQALSYDATVHTFFLGFAFSMIFAHGPIILPGVLGLSAKPFHKILYLWLFFLQLSWIIRIAGDILLNFEIRKVSGMMTALTIPAYFATLITLTMLSQRQHAKIL